MAKKLICVWLSLTILFSCSAVSIYADEVIQSGYFLKGIVINGESIANYKLGAPVLIYNEVTYIPLGQQMGFICGFIASMDNESRTLSITKKESSFAWMDSMPVVNDLDGLYMNAMYDVTVKASGSSAKGDASEPEEEILELGGMPVLERDSVYYVPLKTMLSSELLGWTCEYSVYSGICISTDADIDASFYFSEEDSEYIEDLYQYIRKKNPNVGLHDAMEMLMYFMTYGDIYGVSPELLIAMTECESTFYQDLTNSHGCIGLMQIKDSTGAGYGFSRGMLLTKKYNIKMGTMYISEMIERVGDDVFMGLCAYNNGYYAVKSGNYGTGYASKVLSRVDDIFSYAENN